MATCLQHTHPFPFVFVCSGPGWSRHTGTGGFRVPPGKVSPHSCTEADLVKLSNLPFWLCRNRCVNWGWMTSTINVNSCLKLDTTSSACCLQMLGVTSFVLCGRYEATTSWCNCEFPYGKDPCLKRASKGKDKKKNRTT